MRFALTFFSDCWGCSYCHADVVIAAVQATATEADGVGMQTRLDTAVIFTALILGPASLVSQLYPCKNTILKSHS